MHDPDHYDAAVSELASLLEPIVAAVGALPVPKLRLLEEEDSAQVQAERYRNQARSIANRILGEALEHGVPQLSTQIDLSELGGGAASDFVFRAKTHLSFVVKVQRDPKLREEFLWLASMYPEIPNATPWGNLFPRVLAKSLDRAPYAYAMEDFRKEDGYLDLAAWIFDGQLLPAAREAQAQALLHDVLKTLSNVYTSSKNPNSRTSIDGDAYLKRITDRMAKASGLYEGFRHPAIVDGVTYQPWEEYISKIAANRAAAEALFPNFETVVHGDAHPGNIIVRVRRDKVGDDYKTEVRLIDPKGWAHGDYVFDFAKVAHYLELTGPFERLGLGTSFEYEVRDKHLVLKNCPTIPEWVKKLGGTVREAARSVGKLLGDDGADNRFALAMASCLLGTVPLRWQKGQHSLAVLMYAEGMRWLARFCDDLQTN